MFSMKSLFYFISSFVITIGVTQEVINIVSLIPAFQHRGSQQSTYRAAKYVQLLFRLSLFIRVF